MNTHRRWPLTSVWCGNSCAPSRFSVVLIVVQQGITAVLATLHTPSENISLVRLLCLSVSVELDTDSGSHSAARLVITCCPSSLFFFQFRKFTGCFWVVFFRRVLSKHWRCLGLWVLSGCEVFVTVAKPTPSVMAQQSTSVHVYTHSFTHSWDGDSDWLYGCWQRCLGDVDCRRLTLERCHPLQHDKRQTVVD